MCEKKISVSHLKRGCMDKDNTTRCMNTTQAAKREVFLYADYGNYRVYRAVSPVLMSTGVVSPELPCLPGLYHRNYHAHRGYITGTTMSAGGVSPELHVHRGCITGLHL
jgi:hypothetical protein